MAIKFLDYKGLQSVVAKMKAWVTGQKGVAGGFASLDSGGKVPAAQLPSYVDDVLDGSYVGETVFNNTEGSPYKAEAGKIYVDTKTNKTYRWSGTKYVEISSSLALGETSSTAFAGDKGKIAYTHSQAAHAPSNAQKNVQADWNETISTSDAFIKNKPTSMPANGGNAATVGGHTVETNVPANAKFTDTVYSHPKHTGAASGLYKVTVDAEGHVSATVAVTKEDITKLGIPGQDTTYQAISTSEIDGLFRA